MGLVGESFNGFVRNFIGFVLSLVEGIFWRVNGGHSGTLG